MARYWRLFNIFQNFSFKTDNSDVFSRSDIRMTEDFFVIIYLVDITGIMIDYYKSDFFLKQGFKSEQGSSI